MDKDSGWDDPTGRKAREQAQQQQAAAMEMHRRIAMRQACQHRRQIALHAAVLQLGKDAKPSEVVATAKVFEEYLRAANDEATLEDADFGILPQPAQGLGNQQFGG